MILAFAHPALVVPDLQSAIDFYRDMFGFEVIGMESWRDVPSVDAAIGVRGSAARGCMLKGHNCFLELFEFDEPDSTGPGPQTLSANEPGLRHLAFYVDDCQREYARMVSLGGQVMGEPRADENGCLAVYGRDPFGNIIELCEIPNNDEVPTELPGVCALGNFSGTGP